MPWHRGTLPAGLTESHSRTCSGSRSGKAAGVGFKPAGFWPELALALLWECAALPQPCPAPPAPVVPAWSARCFFTVGLQLLLYCRCPSQTTSFPGQDGGSLHQQTAFGVSLLQTQSPFCAFRRDGTPREARQRGCLEAGTPRPAWVAFHLAFLSPAACSRLLQPQNVF